jgi:hypothetical protein
MNNLGNDTLTTVLVLAVLVLAISVPITAASEMLADNFPYSYEFAQKYIVAGERVLNLTISNNSTYNIEALEFEARLLDAFGDVISDWSIFSNPDLRIPAGSSGSLTLTLSRKNILGINVENILDKARSFELRYTRILLEDGSILRRDHLYPNINNLYGDFVIELDILNGKEVTDDTSYNFSKVSVSYESELKKYMDENMSLFDLRKFDSAATISELVEWFSNQALILLVKATNVTDKPLKKDWDASYSPVFTLLDDQKNQYSKFAALYIPHNMSSLSYQQLPGVTLIMVYLFDKFDGYEPAEIEVFIENQKYTETFQLR